MLYSPNRASIELKVKPAIYMTIKETITATVVPQAPEGLWPKIIAFLNRDIRSFMPGWQPKVEQPTAKSPANRDGERIDSLVDPGKLDYLAFRREVLDWRDGFHALVTQRVSDLHDAFIQRIDSELGEVGFFRQLITKSANEVLQGAFIREVRVPLFSILRQEEEKLAAHAGKWLLSEQLNFAFKKDWSDSEFDCVGDIGFKPTNREAIHARIKSMMLGDTGIAETYCVQATRLARQLIEKKPSC